MQFVISPAIGFLVVKICHLPQEIGIMLLVITSSPGGSYSNWWCSLFNAELALSVTMTTLSTLLSVILLPTNLVLYTRWTYSPAVVKSLDWSALIVSLVTVISGISGGLVASYFASRRGRTALFRVRANRIGNVAGILLIILSFTLSSTDEDTTLWDRELKFYIGCALPAVLGVCMATYLAKKAQLEPPERVAVAVEACYQNTGIATSVALTLYKGESLAKAIGVPLYYGIVEATLLAIYCMICWKLGWTKAPPNENICVVLYHSYEVDDEELRQEELAAASGEIASPEKAAASPDAAGAVLTESADGKVSLEKADLEQHGPTIAVSLSGSFSSRIRQAVSSVWHGYQPSASSSPQHVTQKTVELPPVDEENGDAQKNTAATAGSSANDGDNIRNDVTEKISDDEDSSNAGVYSAVSSGNKVPNEGKEII
eukprot:scaffold132_cov170-Amphora_coffeaeformis.AAC.16